MDYFKLRVFGCPDAHIPRDERLKNEPKAHLYIFFGFEGNMKGYKLWDSVTRKLLFIWDRTFDERFMLKQREY